MTNHHFREKYLLHFGCEDYEVNSRSLIAALDFFTTTLEEINRELNTGKNLEIKVKPFNPGSFEVPIEIVEYVMAGILAAGNISYIPTIIKILCQFIKIKIDLKGEKPLSIEKVGDQKIFTTKNGAIYHIENVTGNIYLNNSIVNDTFDQGMKKLNSDNSVKNFQIKDSKNTSIVNIEKDNFKYFISSETLIDKKQRSNVEDATLYLLKVVFDETSKWSFIYKGNKISAKILDKDFHKQIKSGTRFGNGDIIEVKLQINQIFDEVANTFSNESYEILKVIKHIPRPAQLKLS